MEELDPKASKCWTCRWGLCVSETEHQSLFAPSTEEEPKNVFELEQEEMPGQQQLSETVLGNSKIKSVCFWRPSSSVLGPASTVFPFDTMGIVHSCNRYIR